MSSIYSFIHSLKKHPVILKFKTKKRTRARSSVRVRGRSLPSPLLPVPCLFEPRAARYPGQGSPWRVLPRAGGAGSGGRTWETQPLRTWTPQALTPKPYIYKLKE